MENKKSLKPPVMYESRVKKNPKNFGKFQVYRSKYPMSCYLYPIESNSWSMKANFLGSKLPS